jgi:hypothetical protein
LSLLQNPEKGFGGTGFQPVHAQAEACGNIRTSNSQISAFTLIQGGHRPPYILYFARSCFGNDYN